MKIQEFVTVDLSDLRTKWPAIVSNKVPTSSCEERFHPHGYVLRDIGNDALGQVSVTYENWHCGWTKGTCTTTGYKRVAGVNVPYPKLYSCNWETKNKWFQKTVRIDTRLAPKIANGELQMAVASSVDDRGGIPNALLNLVGVLTLNVGSKFMLDQYRSIMSDIKSQLPNLKDALAGSDVKGDGSDLRLVANLQPNRAFFDEQDKRLALVVVADGGTKYNTGCAVQKSLVDLAAGSASLNPKK